MTDEKILELAKEAGAWTPMALPTDWNAGDVVFSADELRKFAALVRREALEEAARECENLIPMLEGVLDDCATYGCIRCFDAIRALAAQEADK